MTEYRPMLAATIETEEDLKGLKYPIGVSKKLDGIRGLCTQWGITTRTMKLIPNRYIRGILNHPMLIGLDGEIIVGEPDAIGVGNLSQSGVMSADGNPDFTFYVFDNFLNPNLPYRERAKIARSQVIDYNTSCGRTSRIVWHDYSVVFSPPEVQMLEDWAHIDGYEGLIVRSLTAPYKFGRSTLKQQYLMKLKRFKDAEAVVIGFEPLERNQNEPTKDAFGLQKRSSHKAGKITDELMGKLVVRAEPWGEFRIGSGFDADTRELIWKNPEEYKGKTVTFKYLPYGSKDKPRHPIFKMFRNPIDIVRE